MVFEDSFGATRDEVYAALRAQEIYARKYFYPLTTQFDCYRGLFDGYETPIAAHVSTHVLTLPMFADLALDQVDRICSIVRSCAR